MELSELYSSVRTVGSKAVQLDTAQDLAGARDAYVEAGSALLEAVKLETSLRNRERNMKIANTYLERAQALEQQLRSGGTYQDKEHLNPSTRREGYNSDAESLALAQKLSREETAAVARQQVEDEASQALVQQLIAKEQTPTALKTVYPEASSQELPPGWRELRTSDGTPYYANDMTCTTQWVRPGTVVPPQPAQQLGAMNRNSGGDSTDNRSNTRVDYRHRPDTNGQSGGDDTSDNVFLPVELSQFVALKPSSRGNGKVTSNLVITTADEQRFQGSFVAPQQLMQHLLKKASATRDASEGVHENPTKTTQRPPDGKRQTTANAEDDTGVPAFQAPGVDTHGRIDGAVPDFNEEHRRASQVDSGVAFRNKTWNDVVRQAQERVGPVQEPFQEKISLTDRQTEIVNKSRASKRVNPQSQSRQYAIDGYEKKVYIDPNRSIETPLPRSSPLKPASAEVKDTIVNASVLFETAAMGAKLRNTHRMGGERVKEMDHFVASVETPRANLKIPDVAPLVAEMATAGLEPVRIELPRGMNEHTPEQFDLHVQERFREGNGVSDGIRRHAVVFYPIIATICREFLHYSDPFEVYYMTTMRADVSVCSRSKVNGKLYFNLLVFQQQQPLDDTGALVSPKRIWTYWLQRTAIALGVSDPERKSKPTGLYDPDVRHAFQAHLQILGN